MSNEDNTNEEIEASISNIALKIYNSIKKIVNLNKEHKDSEIKLSESRAQPHRSLRYWIGIMSN